MGSRFRKQNRVLEVSASAAGVGAQRGARGRHPRTRGIRLGGLAWVAGRLRFCAEERSRNVGRRRTVNTR